MTATIAGLLPWATGRGRARTNSSPSYLELARNNKRQLNGAQFAIDGVRLAMPRMAHGQLPKEHDR